MTAALWHLRSGQNTCDPSLRETKYRSAQPSGARTAARAAAPALAPVDCQDLFFVSRNDGSHVFCPDLACHNAAVKAWQVDFFHHD